MAHEAVRHEATTKEAGAPLERGSRQESVRIRAKDPRDAAAVASYLDDAWGGPIMVSHGDVFNCTQIPALLAEVDGEIVGLATYVLHDDALEIVTLNASKSAGGVGTLLLEATARLARERGLARLWLVTTNDNLDAMRFYQRRGMRMVSVLVGAMDRSRDMARAMGEPVADLVGYYGIESHDEIVLEMRL